MAHDLVIRNGTVVDGTGSAPVDADFAIDGDKITAIGDLEGVAAGNYADVNVFDLAALESEYPDHANDFPNGKGRLFVRSRGYRTALVNGEVVTEDGANTGARPGRVLRESRRG